MRLIDADEMSKRYTHYGISHPYDAVDLDVMLAEMPTVEAIPLEWLTKRMGEELEKAVLIGGEHNALSRSLWNVVEYWRREAKA